MHFSKSLLSLPSILSDILPLLFSAFLLHFTAVKHSRNTISFTAIITSLVSI